MFKMRKKIRIRYILLKKLKWLPINVSSVKRKLSALVWKRDSSALTAEAKSFTNQEFTLKK